MEKMQCWEIQEGCKVKPIENLPMGLLYGYSVYTTFKISTAPLLFEQHCLRLKRDSKALSLLIDSIQLPSQEALHKISKALLPDSPSPVVRLTIGATIEGYRDFFEKTDLPAKLFISFRNTKHPPENRLAVNKGLCLQSIQYQRPLPQVKHGAMTDIITLKRAAQSQGFNEILLINSQGNLCEASTANIFIILPPTNSQHGLSIVTPDSFIDGGLPGLTRQALLSGFGGHCALNLSQACIRKESLPVSLVSRGVGAFLTNTVQGIQPISRIDEHIFSWPKAAEDLLPELDAFLSPLLAGC